MSLTPFHDFNFIPSIPRSMFDMDLWHRPIGMDLMRRRLDFGPSTLDLFDPFDELDQMVSRNLMWLNRPDFIRPLLPIRVPQKYRITLDCSGYSANSIKTEISDNRIHVTGREEEKISNENYSIKEFKKSYELPINAETDKLASFMTSNGQLVIEVPLKTPQLSLNNDDLFPKVSDDGKTISMSFTLPENVDPNKVTVTCKDRDLIVRAEDKIEEKDRMSQFSYYKRSTLPDHTDFSKISCSLDKNKLSVTAPLKNDVELSLRQIPIQSIKN